MIFFEVVFINKQGEQLKIFSFISDTPGSPCKQPRIALKDPPNTSNQQTNSFPQPMISPRLNKRPGKLLIELSHDDIKREKPDLTGSLIGSLVLRSQSNVV